MASHDWVELEGVVNAETADAILVDFGGQEEWVPKSQCIDFPDVGDFGTLFVREWLAYNRGLI